MKTSFPDNVHDIRISHPSQSGFIKRRVALLVTIVAVALLGFYWASEPAYAPSTLPTSTPPPPGLFACTQEAKLCPDGSYVGRTGPNCEFAKCFGEGAYQGVYPSQEDCEQKTGQKCGYGRCDVIPLGKTVEEVCGKNFHEGWMPLTSNWKTYRNEKYGFEIKYPLTHEIRDYSQSYITEDRPVDVLLAISFCNREEEIDCDGFQVLVYPKNMAPSASPNTRFFSTETYIYELNGLDYEDAISTFKFIK